MSNRIKAGLKVDVVEAWRLELTRRLLYLKGIIALLTTRNSNEATRDTLLSSYLIGLVRSSRLGR